MKRYSFRLATVLRLRQAELDQARGALAASNLRLRALLLARDVEAAHYREIAGRCDADTAADLRAEQLSAQVAFDRLSHAEQVVAEAAAQAAMAQVAWLGASRRVSALERLEERRREEYDAEVLREEVATVDEIVTARFVSSGDRRAKVHP